LIDGHDEASSVQAILHAPAKQTSATPPKVGQSLSAMQAVGVHTSNSAIHVASSGQAALDEHSGVQNPLPPSCAQCCSVPSALGEQSWSAWQGAQ
jgi:hypothetical protein